MKFQTIFYQLIIFQLYFTFGCAQKGEERKGLECLFQFKKIMSPNYSKEEYECFLKKAKNFNTTNRTDFKDIDDLFEFRLYNRYDWQLNSEIDEILKFKSKPNADKYNDFIYLEFHLNGVEKKSVDKYYINQLNELLNNTYKNALVRPWRDYQMLRIPFVTKQIGFFEFFNSINKSGLFESSDNCIIVNDIYDHFTKLHLKKDSITPEWLDSIKTYEKILSKICPNECLLSRTEWYAFIKDKRFYDFNCDTLGYFHSMYNMCSEMIYLTEQDTIPYSQIKTTRIKMEKMWSMDQYFTSYLGKYVYGFIVKAKAYEYFYEGKYEDFDNLLWNAEDNGYLWKWRGDFIFRRNVEVSTLYEKVFRRDPLSEEAEQFYQKNFSKLFSN